MIRVPLGRPLRYWGYTLLTRPRRPTRDQAKAEASRAIYGQDGDLMPRREGWYSTSLLGILNGYLLHPLRLSLQAEITNPIPLPSSDGNTHDYRILVRYRLAIGRRP